MTVLGVVCDIQPANPAFGDLVGASDDIDDTQAETDKNPKCCAQWRRMQNLIGPAAGKVSGDRADDD